MKTITKKIINPTISYPLENIDALDSILFFDIETTGFSPKTASIYLIGCTYYRAGEWYTVQWFAQNISEEKQIIEEFFLFTKTFTTLIHFNGNQFDIPFIMHKCELYGLDYSLDHLKGIDLLKRITPYKHVLGLPNCKQKTVELFLNINRKDLYSGGDLIDIYKKYIIDGTPEYEELLLLHNEEDCIGMLMLLPILAYYDLFHEPVHLKKITTNTYGDINGFKRKELLIQFIIKNPVPVEFSYQSSPYYLKVQGTAATLRLPVFEEEMKYFYGNYKDYYYLPEEDVALHKSVATFVDRDHRVPAKPATCYTRKHSEYIPQGEAFIPPLFKREYNSKEYFLELSDDLKQNREVFTTYTSSILQHIAQY